MLRSLLMGIVVVLVCINSSPAANFSFPHSVAYSNGIVPTVETRTDMNARVQQLWSSFRSNYVIPDGTDFYRVVYKVSGSESNTCSEAIGYGMLLSVLMENSTNDTQDVFDGLYRYYQSYTNNFGLMGWLIKHDGAGSGVMDNPVAATDADEDVALALMFADKQWGSSGSINYLEEAENVIGNLSFLIRAPYYFFPPADAGNNGLADTENDIEWRKDKVFNPCYFSPAWYREFYVQTEDDKWADTIAGSYSIVDDFLLLHNTGILPDWCDPLTLGVCQVAPYNVYESYFGTAVTTNTHYVMDYDGFRVGWRLGIDYLWNGDASAYSNSVQLSRTMKTASANRPTKIKTYVPDGTQIGTWNELCFAAPVAVAAMADASDPTWLNDLYSALAFDYTDSAHEKYYARVQQLIALMMLSGNFPNLCAMDSSESPELVQDPGFVNQSSDWKLYNGAEFSPWHPNDDPMTVKMTASNTYIFIEQRISGMESGATYDLSSSVYLNNMEPDKDAKLKVQWVRADNSRYNALMLDGSTAQGRSTLSGSATAPADAVDAYVVCAVAPSSSGKAWFDNVSMKKQ